MRLEPYRIHIDRLAGNHYDIGLEQGKLARKRYGADFLAQRLKILARSTLYKHLERFAKTGKPDPKIVIVTRKILAKIHPELLEEILGFSDGVGEHHEKILVLHATGEHHKGCSHFALGGFQAHNYDDSPRDTNNELTFTLPKGFYRHVGFSSDSSGRLDGMNEKGLCTSLSLGGGSIPKQPGIGATLFQRIVLEKASSVDQALRIFSEAPYTSPNIVLLSDASGKAAVIEVSGSRRRITRTRKPIFRSNHYLLPAMRQEQRFENATTRWRARRFQEASESLVSAAKIMDFLTSDFPKGLYEPYFTDDLGTLWSILFEPKKGNVKVSIGTGVKKKNIHFNLSKQLARLTLPQSIHTTLSDVPLEERLPAYKIAATQES